MKILIEKNSIIPAIKYGGSQRVIWYLGKELAKMGHEVSFLVSKGSSCDFAKIIEIDPGKSIREQIPPEIDIVHFNTSVPDGYKNPYVYTLHGNLPKGKETPLNTIFVSKNHAKRFGSTSFVYNGLNWDDYGNADLGRRRKFYHFLAKAAWRVKNLKGAIDITKNLHGEKLKVMGGRRVNFKMGFRFTLNSNICFEGIVNDHIKKDIIEQSKGLLFPVKWHEPFGLAIIESLYFGSPVYGTPYGSLPELVTEDVGFLSDSREEIVRNIKEYGTNYSPKRCHQYARDCFNSGIMAQEYLKKYESVLNGLPLNKHRPISQSDAKLLNHSSSEK